MPAEASWAGRRVGARGLKGTRKPSSPSSARPTALSPGSPSPRRRAESASSCTPQRDGCHPTFTFSGILLLDTASFAAVPLPSISASHATPHPTPPRPTQPSPTPCPQAGSPVKPLEISTMSAFPPVLRSQTPLPSLGQPRCPHRPRAGAGPALACQPLSQVWTQAQVTQGDSCSSHVTAPPGAVRMTERSSTPSQKTRHPFVRDLHAVPPLAYGTQAPP